jgi:hypothetical protein
MSVGFPAVLIASLLGASAESPEAASDGVYLPTARAQTEADEYTLYELLAPETASFRISYEVAATTAGAKVFYNPIRKGSAASDESNVVRDGSVATRPSARILDTGEELPTREMSGAELIASKIDTGETVDPAARVVVIPFTAVKAGQTLRLRITETYTAPVSYRLEGEELVFDRSLGRPRNAVVLPSGWYCTFSAAPVTVTQLPDRRVWLDYRDDRPEAVDVLLKARRRVRP